MTSTLRILERRPAAAFAAPSPILEVAALDTGLLTAHDGHVLRWDDAGAVVARHETPALHRPSLYPLAGGGLVVLGYRPEHADASQRPAVIDIDADGKVTERRFAVPLPLGDYSVLTDGRLVRGNFQHGSSYLHVSRPGLDPSQVTTSCFGFSFAALHASGRVYVSGDDRVGVVGTDGELREVRARGRTTALVVHGDQLVRGAARFDERLKPSLRFYLDTHDLESLALTSSRDCGRVNRLASDGRRLAILDVNGFVASTPVPRTADEPESHGPVSLAPRWAATHDGSSAFRVPVGETPVRVARARRSKAEPAPTYPLVNPWCRSLTIEVGEVESEGTYTSSRDPVVIVGNRKRGISGDPIVAGPWITGSNVALVRTGEVGQSTLRWYSVDADAAELDFLELGTGPGLTTDGHGLLVLLDDAGLRTVDTRTGATVATRPLAGARRSLLATSQTAGWVALALGAEVVVLVARSLAEIGRVSVAAARGACSAEGVLEIAGEGGERVLVAVDGA